MKKAKQFLILVAVIILVSSGCNKLENLLDVTFNAEYTVNLGAVTYPSQGLKQSTGLFSASATIDPTSNSDFLKYAEKIKEIEITSVSAKVLSINKPFTIETASIAVFSESRNTAWNFTNEIINIGKFFTLGNNSDQWAIIHNIIEDQNTFTVLVDGETNVDNVEFTLEITIKTKITANPLENS